MTRLELDNLVKRFADVTAVDGVTLDVEPGSLVALLGPSGCGKTTTLRMIAGLERPSEGDIRFNGESIVGVPPHTRNIGMVFQRYVLFPHMNVADNVGFGLRMRGVDRATVRERVDEVLDIVQLHGLAGRFPSQLSGGQQQRVAIARTVITDPRVMLMDEPLANLDAKLREEMRAFITDLQRRLEVTTVFVTHDQVEAIELADRIGVMFDGRIVQFGTPEDLFNHPRTPRIAEFMGTTNLIEGRLVGAAPNGRGAAFEAPVGTLVIDDAPSGGATSDPEAKDRDRLATIRPEHIDLAPADGSAITERDGRAARAGGNGENAFRARIADATYYGGTVTYRVEAGAFALTVRDRSTRRFRSGEEVVVRLPSEHLWIFPAA